MPDPHFLPMRQVYLHRDEEDWWIAEVPSLPGCVSQGRSREEALANIRDAIAGVIASMRDQGLAVPEVDGDVPPIDFTHMPTVRGGGRDAERHDALRHARE